MNNLIIYLEKIKYFGFRKLYYVVKNQGNRIIDTLIDMGIYKIELYQSLLKRGTSKSLINDFDGDEGHNVDRNKYFIGFGLIHYALVRNIKPQNILCIGSRKGFIPAILALSCKDNKCGHVHFVDAAYGKDNPFKHWSGIGFWKKIDSKKYFNLMGLSNWISIHVMTTRKFASKHPGIRYQYIYIDGDHSYGGVKTDYHLFWPKLDKGGFMVFHDVVAQGYLDKGKFGVWRFWNELKHKNKIIFPFPEHSGLGMIQK